jgi:hypothetical protein
MKKILSALIFIAFLGIIYGISFFIAGRFGLLQTRFFSIFTGGVMLFGLLGLSYNYIWNLNSYKKRPFLSTVIILLCLLVLNYFARISLQVYVIYKHMSTTEGKHLSGKIFQSDPVLGHVPVKCNSGTLSLKFNHTLLHRTHIKFDENGFRIPVDTSCNRELKRPLILFLGDSFTEGADCEAEKVFSSLVGDSIHGTCINAGVSSYGFSQMLLLARMLIPEYKPDYVIVQNSPWLSERAISRYAPTFGLVIPSPYFAKVKDSVQIAPPAFPTSCFALNWKYDEKKSKLRNFLDFYFKEGFAVCARDWMNSFLAKLKTPGPIKDQQVAEQLFFDEIIRISQKNKSKLIILNLGDIKSTGNSHRIIKDKNVKFAEADSLLWKNVNFSGEAFQQLYFFMGWTGKDSIVLDKHPTMEAHSIISKSILQTIKN